MNVTPSGQHSFEAVVKGAAPHLAEIARALRGLMTSVMPGVTEVAWPKQGTVGYGVGPKKMSEHFAYIGIQKNHVNLGFFYGADLDDPDQLLRGTGKRLRHIPFEDVKATQAEGIHRLVLQASRHLPKLKGGGQ